MLIQPPIEPMLAKSTDRFPAQRAGRWRYEPKLDGYRAIGVVDDASAVQLWSRRGARLDLAFPELVGALYAGLPAGTVVDGEIVRWVDGRLDFEALQRRYAQRRRSAALAQAEPCHFVLFDVLETRQHGDLRRVGLSKRRQILEQLFRRIPSGSHLSLGMQTADPGLAQIWYDELPVAGVEGLVVKPADSRYTGQREWLKYKAHRTTDAIVGGVTGSLTRPECLLLGRYASDTGELRYVGRTTPLTDTAAAAVAPLLVAAEAEDHPWPDLLVTNWHTKPSPYLRVEPTLVVEIRADVATDQGRRWRHAVRYLRTCDIDPADVPLDLNLEA